MTFIKLTDIVTALVSAIHRRNSGIVIAEQTTMGEIFDSEKSLIECVEEAFSDLPGGAVMPSLGSSVRQVVDDQYQAGSPRGVRPREFLWLKVRSLCAMRRGCRLVIGEEGFERVYPGLSTNHRPMKPFKYSIAHKGILPLKLGKWLEDGIFLLPWSHKLVQSEYRQKGVAEDLRDMLDLLDDSDYRDVGHPASQIEKGIFDVSRIKKLRREIPSNCDLVIVGMFGLKIDTLVSSQGWPALRKSTRLRGKLSRREVTDPGTWGDRIFVSASAKPDLLKHLRGKGAEYVLVFPDKSRYAEMCEICPMADYAKPGAKGATSWKEAMRMFDSDYYAIMRILLPSGAFVNTTREKYDKLSTELPLSRMDSTHVKVVSGALPCNYFQELAESRCLDRLVVCTFEGIGGKAAAAELGCYYTRLWDEGAGARKTVEDISKRKGVIFTGASRYLILLLRKSRIPFVLCYPGNSTEATMNSAVNKPEGLGLNRISKDRAAVRHLVFPKGVFLEFQKP
jgi:hypothetical protein